MDCITARQRDVLSFIAKYIKDRNMPPTRKEISENFGFISHNSAQCHLEALEKKGLIELVNGSRGIIFSDWESYA